MISRRDASVQWTLIARHLCIVAFIHHDIYILHMTGDFLADCRKDLLEVRGYSNVSVVKQNDGSWFISYQEKGEKVFEIVEDNASWDIVNRPKEDFYRDLLTKGKVRVFVPKSARFVPSIIFNRFNPRPELYKYVREANGRLFDGDSPL